MEVAVGALAMLLSPVPVHAQGGRGADTPDSVTVPFVLSHDRILLPGRLRVGDEEEVVDVWVDPGNPDLWVSGGLVTYVAERGVALEDVTLILDALCLPLAHAGPPRITGDESVGPGLWADLNLPSTLLKDYEVVVDYGRRTITLATPGRVALSGVRTPVVVNASNGLVVVTVDMDGRTVALGLDPGTPVSFLSEALAGEIFRRNPGWPRRVGAVGKANLWGTPDEAAWILTAMPPIKMGAFEVPAHLAVVLPAAGVDWLGARAGTRLDGLLGADALLDLRMGIDFANGALYWERLGENGGSPQGAVGVTLGPARGGAWVILAVHGGGGDGGNEGLRRGDVLVAVDGAMATGRSMGEVWDLMMGKPCEERTLDVDRQGEPMTVVVRLMPVLPLESTEAATAGGDRACGAVGKKSGDPVSEAARRSQS